MLHKQGIDCSNIIEKLLLAKEQFCSLHLCFSFHIVSIEQSPYYNTFIHPLINTNTINEESGIEDIEDSGQVNEKYWF